LTALSFLFLCLLRGAFALSLEDLAGAKNAAALERGEVLEAAQFREGKDGPELECRLLPADGGLREEVARAFTAPALLVEALWRYKKPAGAAPGGWSEAERLAICNQAFALSTLEGLEYFSISKNAMKTLYTRSQVIDGPDTRQPLPDPVYSAGSLPAGAVLYARQKDTTFGDNLYRYEYHLRPGSLVFVQENLTTLRLAFIPVAGKGELRTVMAVLDAEDSLLVYIASMSQAGSLAGLNTRVGRSFAARAAAVIRWFARRADAVFLNH